MSYDAPRCAQCGHHGCSEMVEGRRYCQSCALALLARQVTERDAVVEFWRRGELAWQEWAARIAGKPEGGWHGDSAARDIIEARLAAAAEAFTRLRAMAAKPMKSWDAGHVIDAQRVDEIAEEALEALNPPDAAPACPRCGGSGEVSDDNDGYDSISSDVPCPVCATTPENRGGDPAGT